MATVEAVGIAIDCDAPCAMLQHAHERVLRCRTAHPVLAHRPRHPCEQILEFDDSDSFKITLRVLKFSFKPGLSVSSSVNAPWLTVDHVLPRLYLGSTTSAKVVAHRNGIGINDTYICIYMCTLIYWYKLV